MITILRSKIKEAMIEKKNTGNSLRYQTLKNILEKAQKTAKDAKTDIITNEMVVNAAKKEVKQLQDLLEYCEKDTERYNETVKCIEYAEEIMPKMASDDEVVSFLNDNKSEITNIGAGMKLLKSKFGESLDSKKASVLVKNFLAK